MLIRLAALLHDVGHGPFSHVAEELLPIRDAGTGERFKHEHYTAAIVRRHFADLIRNHPLNTNYDFTADDVSNLLEGKAEAGKALLWRDLISGQLDADRMDYLLRDSLHCGVGYGRYDWQRLVHTVAAVPGIAEQGSTRIGVAEGGWHAAEALIIARYFMFTQVYFHKTRVIYDHHLQASLGSMLPGGQFPGMDEQGLTEYLAWDDWRVLGLLASGAGGEHGRRLASRDHYREIAHSSETPSPDELARLGEQRRLLGDLLAAEVPAAKSWYKVGPTDVLILAKPSEREVKPLSLYSSVVRNIQPIRQVRLYARPEHRNEAVRRIAES